MRPTAPWAELLDGILEHHSDGARSLPGYVLLQWCGRLQRFWAAHLEVELAARSFDTNNKEGVVRRISLKPVPLCLLLMAACGRADRPVDGDAGAVERGSYLATFGGCHDCHTPKIFTAAGPVRDSSRLLAGHPSDSKLPAIPAAVLGPKQWGALVAPGLTAWAGPWGVSFTANLTPDATGLGGWTVDQFIQTMRTGKHLGIGRPILPPMPWYDIGQLTDDDLRALFAYLRSLKPVENPVPAPLPPAGGPMAR